MSRTFRRKGYEATQNTSWDKHGNSVAGYYTESDLVRRPGYNGPLWYCVNFLKVYREPTKAERFRKWYSAHGESRTASERSPNKWHRQHRQNELRTEARRQLNKFLRNDEYEPIIRAKPTSHYWDWD